MRQPCSAIPARKFFASIKGQMRFFRNGLAKEKKIKKSKNNKIMEITGRVTGDAKVRETKSGKKVTGFNIAINRSYKKGDERIEVTTYIECSYWINSAIAEYLRKGTVVQFSGDLGTNAWVDKDGKAQASITCNVQSIKILAWPNKEGASGKPASDFMLNEKNGKAKSGAKSKETANGTPDEDDLPF